MGYGDCYWSLYRNYYGDPFPHSLLRTRQSSVSWSGEREAKVCKSGQHQSSRDGIFRKL